QEWVPPGGPSGTDSVEGSAGEASGQEWVPPGGPSGPGSVEGSAGEASGQEASSGRPSVQPGCAADRSPGAPGAGSAVGVAGLGRGLSRRGLGPGGILGAALSPAGLRRGPVAGRSRGRLGSGVVVHTSPPPGLHLPAPGRTTRSGTKCPRRTLHVAEWITTGC